MATSIGTLTVDLRTNTAKFTQGMDTARSKLKGVGKQVSILRNSMLALAGAGAAGSFVAFTKGAVEYADAIAKTSDKLGIATDSLQEYRFAAERSGVTQQAVDVGLQRFTRRLAEAAQGTGVLKDVLKQQNIELRNADGTMRKSEDVLDDYANAIKNAGSTQEQLLLSFKAFDTEGAAMVNMLRNGSAGLESLRDEARNAGVVMDENLIRKAETINDKWDTLVDTIGNRLRSAAIGAASVFVKFDALTEVTDQLRMQEQQLARFSTEGSKSSEAYQNLKLSVEALRAEQEKLNNELKATNEVLETGTIQMAKEAEVNNTNLANALILDAEQRLADEKQRIRESDLHQTRLASSLRLADEQAAADERLRIERRSSDMINAVRMSVFQNAANLIRALAPESKKAAIAALALEKGLGIAQTIINTEVAAMRALAELGPVAGAAAAAKIRTLGAVSVGLIAATGLAQAASINAGDSSTVAPTVDDQTPSEQALDPFNVAQNSGSIQIHVNGVVTQEVMDDVIVPTLENAFDRGVVLFSSNSDQALEITG